MKKTNNKGFSLVELIVVIAIMAVLIGVLAPQFTKYVEQSRRSTDIQNAEAIKTAVLADIADGTIDTNQTTEEVKSGGFCPSAIAPAEIPTIQGKDNKDDNFTVTCDVVAGTCQVFAGGVDLTDPTLAAAYKAGTKEEEKKDSE